MQRVIELLEEEKGRRMREVESMRETIRELAKQATGKDPFAPKSRKGLAGTHPLADLQAKLVNAEVERQDSRSPGARRSRSRVAKNRWRCRKSRLDRAVEEHPNVQALRAAADGRRRRGCRSTNARWCEAQDDPHYLSLTKEIRSR